MDAGHEMANLVGTGISGLDEILGGGIPTGSCVLLLEPPLIESRLFYLEYIYRGVCNGEPGMIVTMDYSPEALKIRAGEYGWDMGAGEEKELLKWVDGYSLNARKEVESTSVIKRIGGSIALSDLTVGISNIQKDFSQSDHYRFVFDSLSTLFIYNDPNTIYRFLRVIISKLRMSGGVGFLTLGEGMHDPHIEMTLRYMMDGTVQVDDNLRMNVLSMPSPSSTRSGKLMLGKTGFSIEI